MVKTVILAAILMSSLVVTHTAGLLTYVGNDYIGWGQIDGQPTAILEPVLEELPLTIGAYTIDAVFSICVGTACWFQVNLSGDHSEWPSDLEITSTKQNFNNTVVTAGNGWGFSLNTGDPLSPWTQIAGPITDPADPTDYYENGGAYSLTFTYSEGCYRTTIELTKLRKTVHEVIRCIDRVIERD